MKTVANIFGVMEGPDNAGRPRREWVDAVKEWCKLDIHSTCRAAQDSV